ncbi:unnamed protein product [Rodentolepis nana]|uniref:Uncharacterized protein n=1 Tax=Rodentolepis nana TaxID=102285 RepID=A0A0R3TX97_RODNA|nr:unnamed protein product [Rodentolepis nana]
MNVRAKIQDLFQWFKNYSFQPRSKDVRESCKLMYDVEVVEGIVKIFIDWSSLDEIHSICRTFYDAYLSGDKKSKFFVTLLLPTMLHTYLLRLSVEKLALVEKATGGAKPPSSPFRRSSHLFFTVGDGPPMTNNPLESLAFLLSEFCQLAPAFVRCPELYANGSGSLPDYRVPSVYHTPPFNISKPVPQPKMTNNSSTSTIKFNTTPSALTSGTTSQSSSTSFSDIDTSCIVRIYVDAMARQFVEGTEEQQAVVLLSIKTYCDMVERLTTLNNRRVLPCAHHQHLTLMIELAIGLDKLLYILDFDLVQLMDQKTDVSKQMEGLRDQMVKVLLPKLERYASYHCFASVLLVVGAVRNAWRLRLNTPTTANVVALVPLYRRVRLTSDDLNDVSTSSNSDEASGNSADPVYAHPGGHRPSIFTNANFKAEPVAEDIPIADAHSYDQTGKRKRHLLHNHKEPAASHSRHLHQIYPHEDKPDGFGGDWVIARSAENLHKALSPSTQSLNHDSIPYYRRFWSRSRTGK